jgi:hypothetical protein
MRKTSAYAVGLLAHKLFTSYTVYPQVVFTTVALGTNTLLTPSLYESPAQLCAQRFFGFNRLVFELVNTMHRPNNNSNKGR